MSTENGQNDKPSDKLSIWFLSPMLIVGGIGLLFYVKHLNETTEAVGHGLDPRTGMALGGCAMVLMGFTGAIFGCLAKVRAMKTDHLSRNARWEPPTDNEWRDSTGCFKMERILHEVDDFFDDDQIWLVTPINRKFVSTYSKKEVVGELERTISENDVKLCDKEFKKIMEFNKDGVFRKGKLIEEEE